MTRGTVCEWCGRPYGGSLSEPAFDGIRWSGALVVIAVDVPPPWSIDPALEPVWYLCSDHLLVEHATAGCAMLWRVERDLGAPAWLS